MYIAILDDVMNIIEKSKLSDLDKEYISDKIKKLDDEQRETMEKEFEKFER